MTWTSNTVIADFDASLAIVFRFLEEQLLERHPSNLPVGVVGLTDGEPALACGVERHDGHELHVHIFALHVNTTPGAFEPNRSGDLWRAARGLGADAGRDQPSHLELVAVVMEFETPVIVAIEDAVAMLHVCTDAGAKLFEH